MTSTLRKHDYTPLAPLISTIGYIRCEQSSTYSTQVHSQLNVQLHHNISLGQNNPQRTRSRHTFSEASRFESVSCLNGRPPCTTAGIDCCCCEVICEVMLRAAEGSGSKSIALHFPCPHVNAPHLHKPAAITMKRREIKPPTTCTGVGRHSASSASSEGCTCGGRCRCSGRSGEA